MSQPMKLPKKLEYQNHPYTSEDLGNAQYNAYPEQIHDKWHPANRIEKPDGDLPRRWKGYNPRSRRAELKHFTVPLTPVAKQGILDTATSREDFHDYDYIHDHRQSPQGCLCELRIATGRECLQHFAKGPDGKTPASANDH